jgi:hypothetical protein
LNKYTAFWGGLVAASGVVMHFLLLALGDQTFFMAAEYLPPAQIVSYAVISGGAALFLASFLTEWPRYSGISNEVAARYFGRIALVNALAAAVFASPMLVPPLKLPILLTEWSGIYIVVAYAFFVIFGVLGMLGWSLMYRFTPAIFSVDSFDRRSILVQLILSEAGIYTVSTVLFLAGYIGARLIYSDQVGSVLVGASMEFSDLPAAVSIFIIIVSVFLGAISILTGKRTGADVRPTMVLSQDSSLPAMMPDVGRKNAEGTEGPPAERPKSP